MKKTGRKFRCIGLEEINVDSWSHAFILGDFYYEATDHLGLKTSNSLYLLKDYNDFELGWYVDISQFELVI